jgi:beta-galactosidase
LLSHDFESNPTYEEAKTIGKDFQRLSSELINLKKTNEVAILFSNEALTAFNQFRPERVNYNDVLRPIYDGLFRMNAGVDFIDPSSTGIENYKLLIVSALYSAADSLLQRLNHFVKSGGHIVYTFKSGFSDQNVKVRSSRQPGIIDEACGISYNQFTIPHNVFLKGELFPGNSDTNKINTWMELITPTTANVLASYNHPVWGKYAAITQNNYGKGLVTYIGCMTSTGVTEKVLVNAVKQADLWTEAQNLSFPVITKQGINEQGKTIRYLFNYSARPVTIIYSFGNGQELLNGEIVNKIVQLN